MKRSVMFMAFMAVTAVVIGQSPQKMSYQAVVRSAAGELIPNHAVGMKVSILQGSSTGTVVFSETYSPNPQTNANGLVTLEIGSGTASVGSLSAINWSDGPYFLKTEADPAAGTDYTITGTSQLLSVPYAMHASTAGNVFSGNYNDLTNKPLLFSGSYNDLTNKPLLFSGSYDDLLNKPVLFSGSYNDLTNKPVLFDGTWNSLTGKPAGFADGIDNIDDADNSITNEIQALSLSGTLLTLSNGGGTVTLPSSGGGDNWGTQTVVTNTTLTGSGTTASPLAVANSVITPSWTNIQSIPAGFADGTDNIDDADNSITNEIQALSIAGSNLSLSSGGGTVAIPGDNWGTQTAVTDATLTGNGTAATPLKIAQQSATSGQVLKWTGTTWSPETDLTGEFTLPYTGTTNTSGPGISVTNSNTDLLSSAIYGYATSTATERTLGVGGRSASGEGVGVYGSATSTTGNNYGVLGFSVSQTGIGVFGGTTASAGKNYGVYGQTFSTDGTGVYGNSIATTGINYGVYGSSVSSSGVGVYGQSKNIGVYGNINATDGYTYGVYGVSGSVYGYGVYGKANSTAGETYGVYGISETPGGFGVKGVASATTGLGIGLFGESQADQGKALLAIATSESGLNYGVVGETRSPSGFAGYFKGGKFYVSGNVGIGNNAPTYKLDVTGNRIRLQESGTSDWIALRTDGGTDDYLDLSWGGGSLVMQGATTNENVIINPSMNKVGIRTWYPMYELDVAGNIRATGSVYYGGTAGAANGTAYTKPDYVFENSYETLNTDEVEKFLQEEKHLPWVTSARQEMKENGSVIDITRMAFETLEAVENLQLQIIEQNQLIRELKAENAILKESLTELIKVFEEK